jgi:hypothetical protein
MTEEHQEHRLFSLSRFKGKLYFLLPSLLLLFFLFPFLEGYMIGEIFLNILFSAVLIASIFAVTEKRRPITFAFLLAVPAFILNWVEDFINVPAVTVASLISTLLFLSYIAGALLYHVLKDKKVTGDKLNGAVCIYFLIGLIFALIFASIELLAPGSFSGLQKIDPSEPYFVANGQLAYYSFITLTSTGYGDILPKTPLARVFSVLEAMLGQIYIAMLIARLVGLHIAHGHLKE